MALRLPDWPERLQALIDARQATPFAWGAHDCCLFAVAAVAAVTGHLIDVAPYSTERQAIRVLRDMGGLEFAIERAGLRRIEPEYAQRGDIVLIHAAGIFGCALAVCIGDRALSAGEHGLVGVDSWLQAWRV